MKKPSTNKVLTFPIKHYDDTSYLTRLEKDSLLVFVKTQRYYSYIHVWSNLPLEWGGLDMSIPRNVDLSLEKDHEEVVKKIIRMMEKSK